MQTVCPNDLAEHICYALDKEEVDGVQISTSLARTLMQPLRGLVGTIKLNSVYDELGDGVIYAAQSLGFKTWIDFKGKDIPDTIRRRVRAFRRKGVEYITIHLDGAEDMVRAAVTAATEHMGQHKPIKVYGVTVLTHMTEEAYHNQLRRNMTIEEDVLNLAQLGKRCGVHGIVCSPHEVSAVRSACGDELDYVTPAIRFVDGDARDQNPKRIATPEFATRNGATMLVMGSALEAGAKAAHRALAEVLAGIAA